MCRIRIVSLSIFSYHQPKKKKGKEYDGNDRPTREACLPRKKKKEKKPRQRASLVASFFVFSFRNYDSLIRYSHPLPDMCVSGAAGNATREEKEGAGV